ncbi:MAG: hypothetical protein C0625_14585 [Arcobacter sp.]|nr:MAG: hypothetical protein C0625_14585 [Arcobacter sp.]
MIPSSPNLENRNSINLKDAAGKYFVQEAINIVKSKDEGFLEYQWYKLSDKKQYKKISFVKFFKPFDWYIGYGEYLDDFEIEVMEEAKKRLNLFKFDKNEYVWTHNSKYILLQHPYRKKDIGTDDTNLVDKKNTKIIQLFVSKALEKKEGSFVEYYWNKPNDNKLTKKIAYIRYFEDWDWVIGTGLYLEDIELILKNLKDNKEKEIKHILFKSTLFVLIILFLVIISSLLISRRVNNSFLSYKKKIEKHKDELEEKVRDKTIELHELNEQLEEKITQRVKELKDKDEILTQQSKMVALGEMIGNIAHQWRQPLSAISTAASGLRVKKEMDILDDDDIIEFSDGIVKNANYLSQVIEDFKNYIKGEKLKIDFDLKEAILHALNIFDSSIHNHNLKIIKNFKNEIIVKNYKNELVQALVNILNNAKDALKKYQENEDDRIIFISTDIIDNKAVLIIQDSGNGITENIINKIFEPYFTTKDKEQGTGLGLYMAYKIITDSMEGDIKVENSIFNYNNKSYKGAKFTIILDLKKE